MREPDYEILIKYLDGECTGEEITEVNLWLQSPENREEFELMKKIWQTNIPKLPEPDVESALTNVWNKIELAQTPTRKVSNIYRPDFTDSESLLTRLFSNNKILRFAAVLVALIIGVYFVARNLTPPEIITVNVENARTQIVTLSDNSRITLDAGSSLSYPEEFEDDNRTVKLSGEGFFEISHNPNQPFIILTDYSKITVLGTKFNVTSWSETEKVIVAVADGKVSLASVDNENNHVVIEKNQVSYLHKNGSPTDPVETDISKFISWQDKQRSFQSATLREILSQLERWYNLKFELPDKSYENEVLTIHITNSPIDDIMSLLSAVMDVSYSQEGNVIKFNRR